jgi:hypothetical protein
MPRKKIDYNAMASEYVANGGKLYSALVAGGYSQSTAKRGKKALSVKTKIEFEKATKAKLGARNKELIKVSEKVNNKDLRHMVRGGLISNIAEGEDRAIQSLKAAGNLAELQMFAPENIAGVIVINMPQLPSLDSVPRMPNSVPRLPEEKENEQ